jgi:flagellar biogenesis protein FliO
MKREPDVRSGAVHLLTPEALRASASPFRKRLIALWERLLRLSRRTPRRLRLCESLPLGERRFVAVVEFEAARFLVGGTPSSLVLLSRLADAGNRPENDRDDGSGKMPAAIPERRGETC